MTKDSGGFFDDARFEHFIYDCGYAIMDNGDIVTSDGKPRYVDDVQLRYIQNKADREGRKIEFRFRVPHPEEIPIIPQLPVKE